MYPNLLWGHGQQGQTEDFRRKSPHLQRPSLAPSGGQSKAPWIPHLALSLPLVSSYVIFHPYASCPDRLGYLGVCVCPWI